MSLFGSSAGKATIGAAQENKEHLALYFPQANQMIKDYAGRAQDYLGQAGNLYKPLTELGGKGANLYADAMGLNGAAGNTNATNAFQAGPGYQFAMDQGLSALERRGAAQGRLQSGQTGIDTLTYANGLANQEYGNWLSKLSGYNQMYGQGIAGQANVLGAQSGVEVGTADRLGDLGSQVLSGFLAANNQKAEGREMQAAAKDAQMGSLLGLGGSLLGKAAGAGSLGSIGSFFGYGK